ncbi:MAG: NAD(P)H-hydrate dehydratase [Acidimicrobiales bacterium]
MRPVVTPEEMAAIDAGAPEPVDELVRRAGAAVARAALDLLGGAYGRRVVVVVGKGNNGADGRDAAVRLRRRGVRVVVLDAAAAEGTRLPASDLVVDAAYGTGFRGSYVAPDPGGAPVLAVDIPSGVDGLTGEATDTAVRAMATVTFAARKPGLLLLPGRAHAGRVDVVDIGLDTGRARTHLVDATDVAAWFPTRPDDAHKWRSAVWVVGGSPGMTGAPVLAAAAAARAGAGYVRLSAPGVGPPLPGAPVEVVGTDLAAEGWAGAVLDEADRFRALVVGPGLGSAAGAAAEVRRLVARSAVPVVVDGDGLRALAGAAPASAAAAAVVLTPHDGEFEALAGHAPGADRLAATRALAAATGAVVLLKGPTTVVADAAGAVLVVVAGDARLATAGTGDVLTGTIAALLARGLDPLRAAAAGALLHGRAALLGPADGLVAGDIVGHLPGAISDLVSGPRASSHGSDTSTGFSR